MHNARSRWKSERARQNEAHRLSLSACSHTGVWARVYTCATHTVNAHAHKGQADGYERTRVPLARGGGRDAVFRASFGPENLPTFLVARANGCTSVRRNFGGCTPVLDEVGRGRRDGLNLVQGSGERDGAIYNRRGWRRGRTMNAVRKRFVYQHVPN